ncbi:hypothetical protein PILCRDRAFT_827798 [Piloderma croceum F 1598]|uniref:Thioredoxin domain-containing protein n=1 Tax=Piloderma croceum (strain F 1598) TaxID=765440 RepID=A0A0C3F4Q8_PILCF|nr:hypothetical protein PILCRDRAFT_827798 [Piloderma croceum F 1598]
MSNSNFHEITSPEQFQSLLSQDLSRVSLINFWAPWAGPCKKMNEIVLELAKKYPQLLVLQVEAETQEDIAGSFEVDSVPAFIILRGHTLLSRIPGADAAALTQAIETHARIPPTPLSKTSQSPAPASNYSIADDKQETPAQLEQRMRDLMNQQKIVLFMKGDRVTPRCGFSRKIVALLESQNVTDFATFDILKDEKVRQGLKTLNNWPTFPQLIIDGEFVGGLDVVKDMVDNGELAGLIAQ